MTGQPELPRGLQVVARSGGAGEPAEPLRQELVVGVPERRPGGEDAGAEVDGYDEPESACAAEASSATSGTSASS